MRCGCECKASRTFAGIAEKIPYLKELGVNCVELMPIHEFDEFENSKPSPVDGHMLYNVWGYSNVGFFAPKAAYASTGRFGMQVDELKILSSNFMRMALKLSWMWFSIIRQKGMRMVLISRIGVLIIRLIIC